MAMCHTLIIIGPAHGYLLGWLSTSDYFQRGFRIEGGCHTELYRKRMRMWSYIMAAP